ncbi:MAG TPA: hypothetical protein VFL63_08495 [Rhodanobacteraceae bacterium]|nr:hypothetical protein [Rhodanobacteraceae bacterium]
MRGLNQPVPVRRRAVALAAACILGALLAACHPAPPPPSNVTPEKAISTNLRLTVSGDFDGLMKNRLPPADYAQWRQEWDTQHAHPQPASVAEQKQFAEVMQMLTAAGAEAALLKRLQPELANGDGKGLPPVFASVLAATGKQLINDSPQLGSGQRLLALQVLQAIDAHVAKVDFGDKKKLAKAIDLVCATARQLHVQTLQQWRALDYATSMRDYGIIWNGLQGLLDIYGLHLASSLNDAKPAIVSIVSDEAVVQLHLTIAGTPMTGEWAMRRVDGHWYDAALLDAWRKAHPASAASAAPAGSVNPTPESSVATPAIPASTTPRPSAAHPQI